MAHEYISKPVDSKPVINNLPAPSENKALLDFASENLAASVYEVIPEDQYVIISKDQRVESLKRLKDELRTAPERRKGTATATTLKSFIDHTNRFKDADSAIFANDGKEPSLLTVFDYHRAGSDSAPRYGEHRTAYKFPLTDSWKLWISKSGAKMSQAEFCDFLEKSILDLLPPPADDDQGAVAVYIRETAEKLGLSLAGPDKLLQLARGITIFEGAKATNIINSTNGEVQLEFKTEHTDATGQRFSIPGLFLIGIQVFEGGDAYRIPVRLRYRLAGGSISWIVELLDSARYLKSAIDDSLQKVAIETKLPVFAGSPES